MVNESRRKGRRVEMPAGAVYALMAAMALICITVLAVVWGVDNGGRGPEEDIYTGPDVSAPHLYIENVFFTGLESEELQVKMTIYVTNDGLKTAKGVAIHAWPVVESNNLATEMTSFDLGDIGVNETRTVQESLKLEAGTVHSVELLVFESGKIILKGRAEVSTEGTGGTSYTDTDVRGSSDDSDYDGIPDEWERYHGLDPGDPRDADRDYDDDGMTNLEEYHMNRDPYVSPIETPDDEGNDLGPLNDIIDGDSDNSNAIGVLVFIVLIVGVVGLLIFAAAWIRSRRSDEDEKTERIEVYDPRPGPKPSFPHEIVEGHDDPVDTDPYMVGSTEEGKKVESVKEREE